MYGELVPVGGGDPIPLQKERLRIGRREGNDILLNSSDVSGSHAVLEIREGYWFIVDLRSRNGIRVDGKRISPGLRKRLDPKALVKFGKLQYQLHYDPVDLGAYGMPPPDEQNGTA